MNQTRLTERFEMALVLAHQLHANQVRKVSGIPYVAHLLGVAALVLEAGGTEDEAIAALLHDAIEDQGGAATRQVIDEKFGSRVVTIIDGCTESDQVPKPPWQVRKLQYLEKVRSASPAVRRVSLADKLHNAQSLLADLRRCGVSTWSHFNASPADTLWFYQSLLGIYEEKGRDDMTVAFKQVVSELAEWVRS